MARDILESLPRVLLVTFLLNLVIQIIFNPDLTKWSGGVVSNALIMWGILILGGVLVVCRDFKEHLS